MGILMYSMILAVRGGDSAHRGPRHPAQYTRGGTRGRPAQTALYTAPPRTVDMGRSPTSPAHDMGEGRPPGTHDEPPGAGKMAWNDGMEEVVRGIAE